MVGKSIADHKPASLVYAEDDAKINEEKEEVYDVFTRFAKTDRGLCEVVEPRRNDGPEHRL